MRSGLRGNPRSKLYPIDLRDALLDSNAQHFDRIVIFKSNVEFIRETDLHLLAPYGIGTITETRRCPIGRHYCPARRGFATGRLPSNKAAQKSQEKSQ